jgi:hypothetical protein
MMRKRLRMVCVGCAAIVAAVAPWTAGASADVLPGCASGAAPGQTVFTVGVSASGTPFVSTYIASAPTASSNVGCTATAPFAAPAFSVNGPGVAVFPLSPGGPSIPANVNMVQIGSYLFTVPANPMIQVYQIAPGFYIVRSLDPSQNASVVLPLPGVPPAPNTGPIPSVIH